MPSSIRVLAGTMRFPFLLLTPSCVLLGLASAAWTGHAIDPLRASLVMLGALAAHASVNMFNEWHDFRSGLDMATQRTPFSGGSGALLARPAALRATLAGGAAALLLSIGIGLWLMRAQGIALAPIGLLGVCLVLAYTPWITRHPMLCLLAPGLGFGPVMVTGAQVAITGTHHASTWAVSLVPWALASGLLLLNQFPDVEADRAAGRRHLPIVLGRPRAARVLAALVIAPHAIVPACVALRILPPHALTAMLAVPLAWSVARGTMRHADDIPALVPTMGRNVALTLATPMLLAAGLFWASPWR